MDGDKEGFKGIGFCFFCFFLDVSKLCWQKLPEEVCGCSGESLLHRREFEALRRGTSDHRLAWGNFWSSPSVTAHPFSNGKAQAVLRGPPTICVDGRWWRELRSGGGACWGQNGARCEREVSQRDGGDDEAPWQRVSSVKVYVQRCDTAMFVMYRSENGSQVSECFSNIMFFVKRPGYSEVCLSDAVTDDCSANISQSYLRFWKILRFFQKLLCTPVVSFTDTLSVCIVKKKKKRFRFTKDVNVTSYLLPLGLVCLLSQNILLVQRQLSVTADDHDNFQKVLKSYVDATSAHLDNLQWVCCAAR